MATVVDVVASCVVVARLAAARRGGSTVFFSQSYRMVTA